MGFWVRLPGVAFMMPLFDDESVLPFKLKAHLVQDSNKIVEIAESYFGKGNKNCRWDDPTSGPCLNADWGNSDWWLLITHCLGEETIELRFRWGEKLLEYEDEHQKIKSFVHEVKKPWSEWTEDEIISSPEWIMIYSEENTRVTEKMHAAMVMYSYSDPEAVKKYFKDRPLIRDGSFQAEPQIHKK